MKYLFLVSVFSLVGCASSTPTQSEHVTDIQTFNPQNFNQFVHEVLESGERNVEYRWQDPVTGHTGSVNITQTTYRYHGPACKEYTTTTHRGHRSRVMFRFACKQDSGIWTTGKEKYLLLSE